MVNIRYIKKDDTIFWRELDEHISEEELDKKIRDKMGYVILDDGLPVGILRYNLFWDSIPFCTMLYIVSKHQHKGYGRLLMNFWEQEMKKLTYGMIMTSTQVDETAQHFYRKLGFRDAGSLLINIPQYEQPMEMFFIKKI